MIRCFEEHINTCGWRVCADIYLHACTHTERQTLFFHQTYIHQAEVNKIFRKHTEQNRAIWTKNRLLVFWTKSYIYTGRPRRNVSDFGRVFLMLKYTNITKNSYVQSWTVTEIMAREKCGLLAAPHTVPVSWQSYPFPSLGVVSYDGNSAHASHRTARVLPSAMLRHRWAISCIVLGTLRTTMIWVRVFFSSI